MSKGRSPRKAPALVALTIAGAGAAAVLNRDKIREALGREGDADASANSPSANSSSVSSPNGTTPESQPPVKRFPQPGIG